MKDIYKKLLNIQQEIGAIKKNSENPYFKSNYFDINALLEVVKPVLNKYKILLLQPIKGTSLSTILVDTESGEVMDYNADMPLGPDPQKNGSIITYYRRYSLQSLLALEAEDDDGNVASEKEVTQKNVVTKNLSNKDINI